MIDYEMTQEKLDELLEACIPIPAIALNCGGSISPQENANSFWESLGKEMGFDHVTVKPNGKGDRFFSAEPTSGYNISDVP